MKLKRTAISLFASLAFFYPTGLFLLNGVKLQSASPADQDFGKLCNWDCLHYSELAAHFKPSAFFPLFPWFSKWVMDGFSLSSHLSVLMVSCLFSWIAALVLLSLGRNLSDVSAPTFLEFPKESWILLALVMFFPHFHFWVQGYPEALFFGALSTGFLFLRREQWLAAALFLGLTAVIRPQGIWVVGIAEIVLLWSLLKNGSGRLQKCGALFLLTLPFLGFLYWNRQETGDAFFFLQQQSQWGRSLSIRQGLVSHLPKFDEGSFYLYLSLWASVSLLRKKGNLAWVFLGGLTLAFTEIPLFFGGFYSYTRFASTNLGLFIALMFFFLERPAALSMWLIWSVSRLAVFSHSMTFGTWTG